MILIIMKKKFLFRKKVQKICDDIFFWLNEMNYIKVEEDIKTEQKLIKQYE